MPITYRTVYTTGSARTVSVDAIPNTIPARDNQGGLITSTFHGTATNAQTLNNLNPSTSNDPNTVVIRDANGNAKIGSYLGRVNTKGDLNSLSANYQDFAWVDDEQAFYWYAGNGWFPYDVKRLKEGFTLVNLLGSYGSFSKDSNGDGLADGWDNNGATPSLVTDHVSGTYSQSIVGAGGNNRIFQYVYQYLPYNHTFFVSNYFKAISGTVRIVFYPFYYGSYLAYSNWTKVYSKFKFSSVSSGSFISFQVGAVDDQAYIDDACLYDLTWMDQYSPMPQSLQEKYAVSKWVDMTDDDLANELQYVDGVAYVGVGL